jgi:DNA-binding transcriptional MerR regulator
MRQNNKVEGTKIAQAAKDLNVTSVTIRRYLTEFNIPTTSDENGIKVLPPQAMEELKEVRRLKEEGLTNPKVLEFLEEMRAKGGSEAAGKEKAKAKRGKAVVEKEPVVEDNDEEPVRTSPKRAAAAKSPEKRKPTRKPHKALEDDGDEDLTPPVESDEVDETEDVTAVAAEAGEAGAEPTEETLGEGRSKHSLTCQTCGKVFEHMNPRLRDCLDCYRTKRKERRRGGSDRHKNVIQHPLAQQVANKASAQQNGQQPHREPREREPREREPREREPREREPREREPRERGLDRGADRAGEREIAEGAHIQTLPLQTQTIPTFQQPLVQRGQVRNYRKAIEETRQITGSLKRRLERPDLPEGERRWLEQIYAYQLILHQGWRHLAEYKAATQQQGKSDE